MPTPAYPHDHSPEQEKPHRWQGVCLSRPVRPAIPTGFPPDGQPVGVQIVGPWLEDPTPLKLAEIEREFGSFVPPTMFDD
jgi:amidase